MCCKIVCKIVWKSYGNWLSDGPNSVRFYLTVWDMTCMPLPEQRACHKMSNIHTVWSLFFQTLTDQSMHNSPDQSESKSQKKKKRLTFTGALIFCCTLLVKTCCQNNATESHKSVISVIKIRGISTLISVCISVWRLMWDSVTIHRMKQSRNMWKNMDSS